MGQFVFATARPAFDCKTQSFCCLYVQDLFPFKAYFADAPGTLLAGSDYEADLEKARGCWRHLRTMFQELEECRAFELLKVPFFAYQLLSSSSCLKKSFAMLPLTSAFIAATCFCKRSVMNSGFIGRVHHIDD